MRRISRPRRCSGRESTFEVIDRTAAWPLGFTAWLAGNSCSIEGGRLSLRSLRVEKTLGPSPHNEDFVIVQQALASLPVHQRTAFLLVEVEGLSTDEASSALAVPVGTVKSRCFHARKRLREILGPSYPEVSNYAQPIPD